MIVFYLKNKRLQLDENTSNLQYISHNYNLRDNVWNETEELMNVNFIRNLILKSIILSLFVIFTRQFGHLEKTANEKQKFEDNEALQP